MIQEKYYFKNQEEYRSFFFLQISNLKRVLVNHTIMHRKLNVSMVTTNKWTHLICWSDHRNATFEPVLWSHSGNSLLIALFFLLRLRICRTCKVQCFVLGILEVVHLKHFWIVTIFEIVMYDVQFLVIRCTCTTYCHHFIFVVYRSSQNVMRILTLFFVNFLVCHQLNILITISSLVLIIFNH